MSFTVYAEDVDPRDSVRIYVLEDPGIPNGAYVTPDEPHQRCFPKDPDGTVAVGSRLGPCPMCQSSGAWTYGIEQVPATPDNVLADFAKNYTTAGTRCTATTAPELCAGKSLHMSQRVWCTQPSGGRTYGDGKLEDSSQHGRLRKRTFTWTPLPEQGICLHPSRCTFIVRFQAFDSFGMHSVIKTYEIDVIKAAPQYTKGTLGLIIDGAQETFKDPATEEESHVSSTTYQPQTEHEWLVSERVYKTYINCPMEFAIGVHANSYDVSLEYTSQTMPPGAKIEWRMWNPECEDHQSKAATGSQQRDVWTDKRGRTCAEYVSKGWCKDGGQGPNYATLGGTFKSMARDMLLPADKACCACGAGVVSTCASRTSQAACEDNTDTNGGKRVYPPQNGCKWDGTVCHGRTSPYFVTPGVVKSEWSVSASPPVAKRVMAIFKWTPVRGMEGSRHTVCFKGSDSHKTAPLDSVCSVLHVAKCHYCARVGETLKYVAEQYNFDTNWLRLWNYNYQLTDPDMILRSFLPVVIGSTYKVQPGDTLARLAARLRTTVKKIMEVNPDMHSPNIEPNQELCIMPCTDEAYKDEPFNPYNGAAVNGVGAAFVEKVPRLSKDPPFVSR